VRRPKRWPLEQLAPFLLQDSEAASTAALRWDEVFESDRPVELEIGCGKGGFLIAAAAERPQHNFLGLEIDRALYFYIASRLAKRNLTNARVACADAKMFVRDRVATGSIETLHVYFPDPWWKKRHHKRRLWTPDFAEQCVRILRIGGRLHIATDVGEYYEAMRTLLDARRELARESADERVGSVVEGESLTNFELKARVKGGVVWRAQYVRQK
jgi:tRNA (guanine-N7-)-methyltransferase